MGETLIGVALSLIGASMYATGITLQAIEARSVGDEHALKLGLIKRLLVRKRWLAGTAIGILGWVFEAAALLLAPLTVVQPSLSFALVVLLILGSRVLKEKIHKRDMLGVACVFVGVFGIAALSPPRETDYASAMELAIVIGSLAFLALLPRIIATKREPKAILITIGAGFAYAWAAFNGKLFADALSTSRWLLVSLWLGCAVISGVIGLMNEMTALQRRRASQVAPVIFVMQMLLPVILAPTLLGERWDQPLWMILCILVVVVGVAALASSRAVSQVVGAASEADGPDAEDARVAASEKAADAPKSAVSVRTS